MDRETAPPTLEITKLHAEICSALADPRRILLLYAVSLNPRNVSELADEIGMSQPAASRHLRLLQQRGLVNSKRIGMKVEYHIADHRLIQALEILRSVLQDSIAHKAKLLEQ